MPVPVEPDFEELLVRLVPGLEQHWQGATSQEIEQIEELSDRPLPNFYRWFLQRMGRSMGPAAFASFDFSAATVLANQVAPGTPLLLIGFNADEVMPSHTFYNLEHQVRDDACVETRLANGSYVQTDFETFRERLGWGLVLGHRVVPSPDRCRGYFALNGPDLIQRVSAGMHRLGFTSPIATGAFCAIFERDDAHMVVAAAPHTTPPDLMFFNFGGSDPLTLRQVLGALTTQDGVQVGIKEWHRNAAKRS